MPSIEYRVGVIISDHELQLHGWQCPGTLRINPRNAPLAPVSHCSPSIVSDQLSLVTISSSRTEEESDMESLLWGTIGHP